MQQLLFYDECEEQPASIQPKKYFWVQTRLVRESGPFYCDRLNSPDTVAEVVRQNIDIENCDRELFIAMFLDRKNNLNAVETVHIGGSHQVHIDCKMIFKAALLASAEGVILVHNHPTGDPNPSAEDLELTRRMVSAGDIIGIEVMDHIILGNQKHFSMKASGLM